MAELIVVPLEGASARAEEIAGRLGLKWSEEKPASGLILTVASDRLGLAFAEEKNLKPFSVDFLSPEWMFRHRRGLRANKSFLQALGLKEGTRILDATAGFGQDSFVMGWAGADVTAVERSHVVFELLNDGLRRAFEGDSPWGKPFRIETVLGDSREILKKSGFDVVYLDPMFEKPKSSAKSPKAMQLLQALLDEDSNSEDVLKLAMKKAPRVVLKLPLKAPVSGKPNFQMKGQSIRYDVYTR